MEAILFTEDAKLGVQFALVGIKAGEPFARKM